MAKITAKPQLDLSISFSINESEARALEALSGYSIDKFLAVFYEELGEAYMKKHEDGLRQFLEEVRKVVKPALSMIDESRLYLRSNKNEQS